MLIASAGCGALDEPWPTYPSGGEYTGGPYGGEYDGGGGDYDPPYDDGPDWSRQAEGEWEGFMWETYRSDHEPLGKRKVAVRIRYSRTTHDGGSRHEWVNVDALVDGRPMGGGLTEISSSGCLAVSSSHNDFQMGGCFREGGASGSMSFTTEEKVKDPYTGGTETHTVHVSGDFSLGRVCGSHWAQAWELIDVYGEVIRDLPDEVWEAATFEALQHLDEIEEAFIRQPEYQNE